MAEGPSSQDRKQSPMLAGGRYRLTHKLGQGGMAAVYRSYDNETEGWVAVKILLATYADPQIRARFEAEARAMQRLSHRNVIKVLAVATDEPLPFFVMELAESGTLNDWIEQHGPMPPRLACDVAIQICKAVAVAHRSGIVHRDIKPKNVLVNRRGVCKLTDFGIAWIRDEVSMTETGKALGTVGFVAPEQRTNARDATVLSDVYSIGSTLYTLVTAKRSSELFFADQEPGMLEGVPEPLKPLIRKATRYQPHDRYTSARRLARALFEVRNAFEPDPADTPSLVLKESTYEADEEDSWSEVTDAFAFAESLNPEMTDEHVVVTLDDEGPRPVAEAAEPIEWQRIAAIFTALVVIFVSVLLVVFGAITVGAQRENAEEASRTWVAVVRGEDRLLDDLATLGAQREPLQQALDAALAEAEQGELTAREADQVIGELRKAHRGHMPRPESQLNARSRRVTESLRRVDKAHQDWAKAVEIWRAAAGTPHGAIAVALRIESAPPE